MSDVIYPDKSYEIIGASFEVYNRKGSGFLESVYHECLEIEFGTQEIPFESQKKLSLSYRNKQLDSSFKPDFLCFKHIIVEIKALSELTDDHMSQVLNYLKATGMKLALLINFGNPEELEHERIVLS